MAAAPSLTATDFELFDLPVRFRIDTAALDAQWKRLQSAAHPDRFAAEGESAQRLAMQWAVRINEAYRRLKDPLRRAAYLCMLHGQDLQAETNTAMPADFLMQQMEWRESLESAADLPAVERLAAEVAQLRAEGVRQLQDRIDTGGEVDWPAVAAAVRQLMFVERFANDVARRIDALDA